MITTSEEAGSVAGARPLRPTLSDSFIGSNERGFRHTHRLSRRPLRAPNGKMQVS
jgi:hypothetical protein